MKPIAYISQLGTMYENVDGVPIDTALQRLLRHKSMVDVVPYTVLSNRSAVSRYRYVFLGFNIWRMYLEHGYEDVFENLVNTKKLSVPPRLLRLVGDKCKLHRYYDRASIPTLPTVCLKLKSITQKMLNKLAADETMFVKTNPGIHTINTRVHSKGNSAANYIKVLKEKDYYGVIVQPYVHDFATEANPEIRTIWVGHKFSHSVHTVGSGTVIKETKRLSKELRALSLDIIRKIERDFKFQMVYCRLDFGKHNGKFFLNEMELFPGVFPEVNPKVVDSIAHRIREITKQL